MIKIEIIDPATHAPSELRNLAAFFTACADGNTIVAGEHVKINISKVTRAPDPAQLAATIAAAYGAGARSSEYLVSEDNPATGASTQADTDLEAAQRFFGQGGTAPSSAGVDQSLTALAAASATVPASVPPPPAPNAADLATTAAAPIPPAPPAPGVTLDSHGLPWDARIHSGGGAKIGDGSWKKKRGVDPEVVAQIEAQLRQLMAIPPMGTASIPPRPLLNPGEAWPFKTAEQLGITHENVGSATAAALAPPVPNVPPPPPTIAATSAPPATPVPSGTSATPASPINAFPALVTRILTAKTAGLLTDDHIKAILANVGVTALPLLVSRPDLIPAVIVQLDSILGS